MDTVMLFGIRVLCAPRRAELLTAAAELIGKGGVIATVNPEIIEMARKSPELYRALCYSLNIPDGRGVALAAALRGSRCAVFPGVELGEALLDIAPLRLGIIGGEGDTSKEALHALAARHGGTVPVMSASGFGIGAGEYAALVREARADMVFVCMGAGRQELLAAELHREYPSALYVCLGGSVNVYAGRVRRAPRLWRTLGLEWLWRALREPQRFVRIFRSLPFFGCIFAPKCADNAKKSSKNH